MLSNADRQIARALPPSLRNFYTRAMRRFAEYGLPRGENVRETEFGFRIAVDRLDAIKWFIHYFGCFEPSITKAWLTLLRPGDLVIDIGGNVGYHTLLAAAAVGPNGRVLTFEASSRIFAQLKANIDRNAFAQVTPHHCAVSNAPGSVTLYYGGANAQGDSSIMHRTSATNGEEVTAISFAEIAGLCQLPSARIIKIDVEGAEALVVAGLVPYLDQLASDCVIFLEISPLNHHMMADILAPFAVRGFDIRLIENSYRTEYFDPAKPIVFRRLSDASEGLLDLVITRDGTLFDRMSEA